MFSFQSVHQAVRSSIVKSDFREKVVVENKRKSEEAEFKFTTDDSIILFEYKLNGVLESVDDVKSYVLKNINYLYKVEYGNKVIRFNMKDTDERMKFIVSMLEEILMKYDLKIHFLSEMYEVSKMKEDKKLKYNHQFFRRYNRHSKRSLSQYIDVIGNIYCLLI